MELNKIQSSGSWGKAADDLNQNFNKVDKAVEQVKNATTRNKGYFSTDAALKSAFKSASLGDIAYVGSEYPYQTWAWNGSEWEKKNENGGQEYVNLGDYYTKENTDQKLSETSEEISGLRTETDQKLSELGSYENCGTEWVRVVTDKYGRILYGVKTDGKLYFGAGCPPQVVEYVQQKIDEDITSLLDEKVDKIHGMSLINESYAMSQNVVENPEYLDVKVDSKGRIIEARKRDGTKLIYGNIEGDGFCLSTSKNERFLEIKIDTSGKVIEALTTNGEKENYVNNVFKGDVTFEKNIFLKKNSANSLKETLDFGISSINSLNPFNEFYPAIRNMARKRKGGNTKPLVLCHFSDIHGSVDNYRRIIDFMSLYKPFYDDIILTGDIVSTQYDNSLNFMSTENVDKCLLVIGNHDSWERNALPIVIIPQKQVYDKFLAPWISEWGVTQPTNASVDGKCYYYKDYLQSNIRLIVTDCMHDSVDQLSWVTNVLADAKDKGLYVIMSQHYPADGINRIECSFQSIDVDGTGLEDNSYYVNAVEEFIQNGGTFICWITGHMHADLFGYLQSSQNQLQISIDCAVTYSDNDVERIAGTKTQDCFNIYSIDAEQGFITILRVGANIDRHLQKKDILIYDFINKKIIK